jgi:16S rRNA (cytidine1402-2'-O)-methyltransferase
MSLVVVATPIGNLGDLSPRARQALEAASFWIVEDSRVSGRLQQLLEVKRPMAVLNDHTPPHALGALADRVEKEGPAALISDAGTPAISDPGANLVDLLRERGIDIDAIPGPTAVAQALALSGFFAQRYAFLGFLPRKPGPAKEVLEPFKESTLTLVFFESPFRVDALLKVCAESLGERRFSICRELTKMHQQVHRGTLPDIPSEKVVPHKGEFTIVVEGFRRNKPQRFDEYNR